MSPRHPPAPAPSPSAEPSGYPRICLYVAGDAPNSRSARQLLWQLSQEVSEPPHEFEVVDVLRHPERALQAQLLATPTLIIEYQDQNFKFVGDFRTRPEMIDIIRDHVHGRFL